MAAINIQKYIDSLKYTHNVDVLNGAPDLNLEQIALFDEPYRKLLYAYYGHITQLDNYTIEELNESFYDGQNEYYKNVYILAVKSGNLNTIKYLHSRNINYDFVIYQFNNIYYLAIYYNNLKLIKYYDSNIFCF
jgi:hypothetical protein